MLFAAQHMDATLLHVIHHVTHRGLPRTDHRGPLGPRFRGGDGCGMRGRRVEYGGDGWSAGVGVRETGEEGDCGSVGSRGGFLGCARNDGRGKGRLMGGVGPRFRGGDESGGAGETGVGCGGDGCGMRGRRVWGCGGDGVGVRGLRGCCPSHRFCCRLSGLSCEEDDDAAEEPAGAQEEERGVVVAGSLPHPSNCERAHRAGNAYGRCHGSANGAHVLAAKILGQRNVDHGDVSAHGESV